jgi:uncharacterized RDD family membrane protein YckC
MSRTAPRSLRSLIVILVIAILAISLIVVLISLGTGSVPSWALGMLIGSFIVLVFIRIIAMVGYGYPSYDFSRLYGQSGESKEKKK